MARRDVELPEEDQDFLNDVLRLPWETVRENAGTKQVNRLIIDNFPIPDGYNVSSASLYLRIEGGYPGSQIDMVYFHPHLSLSNGRAIGRLENDHFDGKVWQRWSRHRTAANPWEPGLDNVQTHLVLVEEWLKRELRKGGVQ